MSATIPILDIPVEKIDGTRTSLAEHRGKVLLIVNVASQCGFTPQYATLETLYEERREKGFVVCGFPANEFAGQEPGSNQEIRSFCETSFGVSFPMYAKIAVTGAEQHPLYSALIRSTPETTGDTTELRKHLVEFGVTPTSPPEVLWNFEKFLVARDGKVVKRFAPDVVPNDPQLQKAIEEEINRVF
ncbi:MAG: glutathione peroxidase [Silvibacterium sp.]|jgi:glutathione peroxidase